MFSNLLVALDGSAESERILPLAESIARTSGADLHLLKVIDDNTSFNDLDSAVRYLAAVNTRLREKRLTPGTHVATGDAAEQILREVERVHADVVLMTTHGRGGLKRAVFGSVTEQVFARCKVPVLALRDGRETSDQIRTILVPMNDSLGSAQSLGGAKVLARATGARIELLHVVEPLVRYFQGRYIEPEWEENIRVKAERDMKDLATALIDLDYPADGRALIGKPSSTIVKTAQDIGADLIVMTTTGHTGVARAILGSVADEVLRTSDVPVMLLHFNVEQGLLALRQSATEAGAAPSQPAEAGTVG